MHFGHSFTRKQRFWSLKMSFCKTLSRAKVFGNSVFRVYAIIYSVWHQSVGRLLLAYKMTAPFINKSSSCSLHCLIAFTSYWWLIKSVIHTVLSKRYLWKGCYCAFMRKILHNLLSADIANVDEWSAATIRLLIGQYSSTVSYIATCWFGMLFTVRKRFHVDGDYYFIFYINNGRGKTALLKIPMYVWTRPRTLVSTVTTGSESAVINYQSNKGPTANTNLNPYQLWKVKAHLMYLYRFS